MKKTNFRSTINYDHTKQYRTQLTGTELTVPDMSLTPAEMLKRYASGRPINVKVYDEYSGDDDFQTGVDIRTLDISQIHDMIGDLSSNLSKLKSEADQRRKKEQDEKLEASIIAKYEARRKTEQQQEEKKPVFVQTSFPVETPKE